MSGAGFLRERTRLHIEAAPALAAVPVIASAVVYLLNTRHGIGVLPDSVGYMRMGTTGARFAPLTIFDIPLLRSLTLPHFVEIG